MVASKTRRVISIAAVSLGWVATMAAGPATAEATSPGRAAPPAAATPSAWAASTSLATSARAAGLAASALVSGAAPGLAGWSSAATALGLTARAATSAVALGDGTVSGAGQPRNGSAAGKPSLTANSPGRPTTSRIAGPDRYANAIAIARRAAQLPRGRYDSKSWFLVRGDRPADAVAVGGYGGPVLFLPPTGPISPDLVQAAKELGPSEMLRVVGSRTAIPDQRARAVVDATYPIQRLDVERRGWDHSILLSYFAAGDSGAWGSDDGFSWIDELLLARTEPLAEAAAAVQARWARVVLQSGREARPLVAPDVVFRPPHWQTTYAIGDKSTVSDASLPLVSKVFDRTYSHPTGRISGRDRYETAAAVAGFGFPDGAPTVYLANGYTGIDAAAAVGLTDGPVLLVPPCGPLPPSVVSRLRALQPNTIIALGGTTTVCDAILAEAGSVTTRRPIRSAVALAERNTCLLTDVGGVECWGDQELPATRRHLAPYPLPGLASGYRSVVDNCALSTTGTVKCWGYILPPPVPQPITYAFTNPRSPDGLEAGVTKITGRKRNQCALKEDRTVWCWGMNDSGARGDTDGTYRFRAAAVSGLPADTIDVARNDGIGCAVSQSGVVRCWGTWSGGPDTSIRHPPTVIPNIPAGIP